MDRFGARRGGVIPPKLGDRVLMRCRSCGNHFYARDFGFLNAIAGVKCPECGGKDVEKDSRVVN